VEERRASESDGEESAGKRIELLKAQFFRGKVEGGPGNSSVLQVSRRKGRSWTVEDDQSGGGWLLFSSGSGKLERLGETQSFYVWRKPGRIEAAGAD